MICNSVLYAYLAKIADNAEKQHYLDLLCMVVEREGHESRDFNMFLDNLHKFEVLDLHLSIFQPYDLRILFTSMCHFIYLSGYF